VQTHKLKPATLSEAFERIVGGEPAEDLVAGFLETFFLAPDAEKRLATIVDPPAPARETQLDALAGAIAEYLAKQYRLPRVPDWVSEPHRYLDKPWHVVLGSGDSLLPLLSDAGFREYLTFSSPAEFSSRNIFTEQRPLRPGRSGFAQ
jgi:hypothetical protein